MRINLIFQPDIKQVKGNKNVKIVYNTQGLITRVNLL